MPKRITGQREKMLKLYRRYGGDKERVCAAYARAEKAGEVKRESNKRAMSAEEYASRLWNDGMRNDRKRWLPKQPTSHAAC
jgi:hypothetical protein